jgi:hypothetical protein
MPEGEQGGGAAPHSRHTKYTNKCVAAKRALRRKTTQEQERYHLHLVHEPKAQMVCVLAAAAALCWVSITRSRRPARRAPFFFFGADSRLLNPRPRPGWPLTALKRTRCALVRAKFNGGV